MTAVGQTGLPFGNLSRLLLAWVCTEAVRTQSRELFLGASLSGFMRRLDMAPIGGGSRGERTRLRDQMRRLFGCSMIQLAYEDTHRSRPGLSSGRISPRVVSSGGIQRNPTSRLLWDSKIRTGRAVLQRDHPPPGAAGHEHLKALKRSSPWASIFYLWLTYRTFTFEPLRSGSPGVSCTASLEWTPPRPGDKRTVEILPHGTVLRELKKIKAAWPSLNYATVQGVLVLLPSKPVIVPTCLPAQEAPGRLQAASQIAPLFMNIRAGGASGDSERISTKPL